MAVEVNRFFFIAMIIIIFFFFYTNMNQNEKSFVTEALVLH